MSRRGILERLAQGIVLGDGGYLLELERRGYVQSGPYTPEVSIRHPEALRELHVEFLRAGAEVLQALTFYASRDKLGTAGYDDQVEAINRAAVRIAREAGGASGEGARSGGPGPGGDAALVAGTLSLTWQFDPESRSAKEHVRALFDEQVALQAEEGVDFFICETFHYVEEALLALLAVQSAGLPAMVTMAFKETERTRDGYPAEECARILAGEGADIVGANCARDPKHMLPIVAKMRQAVTCAIAAQPVAYRTTDAIPYFNGLPEFPLELDPLQLTRTEMAAYALQARDAGVNFIGSCCGTAAHHVRAMAEALGRYPAASETTADLAKHPILGTGAARSW